MHVIKMKGGYLESIKDDDVKITHRRNKAARLSIALAKQYLRELLELKYKAKIINEFPGK
jgi:hypothetical protein